MYKIELRRQAVKDFKDIPNDYTRLIAKHIDLLEQNPRPPDSKKLKGDAGYSLRIGTYRRVVEPLKRKNTIRRGLFSI